MIWKIKSLQKSGYSVCVELRSVFLLEEIKTVTQ